MDGMWDLLVDWEFDFLVNNMGLIDWHFDGVWNWLLDHIWNLLDDLVRLWNGHFHFILDFLLNFDRVRLVDWNFDLEIWREERF
jgi:hypothetical protein